MAKMRLPGLNKTYGPRRKDGSRAVYYYHRASGKRLPGAPGDPDFMAAYLDAERDGPRPPAPPPAGSVRALIGDYQRSPGYARLRASTRKEYLSAIAEIARLWGDLPVAGIKRQHVFALRDKLSFRIAKGERIATSRRADKVVATLSVILGHGYNRGWCDANVAYRVDKITRHRPIPEWTDEELSAFRARWPVGTVERAALEIGANLGISRADAVKLRRDQRRAGVISLIRQKTSKPVDVPEPRRVAEALNALPKNGLTFIAKANGEPYEIDGFDGMFREARKAAGVLRVSYHGLRKYAAQKLIEAGCSKAEVRAITGHATDSMVDHYARAADRKVMARSAITKLEQAEKPFAKDPASDPSD